MQLCRYFLCTVSLNALPSAFIFFKRCSMENFISFYFFYKQFITGHCSFHIPLELRRLGFFLFVLFCLELRLFCLVLPQTKLCSK